MSQLNLRGVPLTEADYASLEARWITRELADQALLRRVNSLEGAEIVGREGKSGNYAGIVIPYLWPGGRGEEGLGHVHAERIRRDHPDLEAGHDGVVGLKRKYMGAPGRGNVLYVPPSVESWMIADTGLPVVVVEGEFKTLALWRLAWHGLGDAADTPAFVPIGLQGVYSWRGKIGREPGADPGTWDEVKGPVADLGRIPWQGRRVIVLFDSNVEDNDGIKLARRQLTRELEERGSEVSWFRWPADVPESVNGIDDFLAARGPDEAIRAIARSRKVTRRKKTAAAAVVDALNESDWQRNLIRNEDGGLKPILANAITFLQYADELRAMVSYDEFSVRVMALQGTPWNPASREWGEIDDIRLAEHLQREKRCCCTKNTVAEAVAAVSRERTYHPVREYLKGLEWDRRERLDTWLHEYIGAEDSAYTRGVGSRWLISAVARIMEPGCQADHCLILQGPQGRRKSSALRMLAGDWFADSVGDLSDKDSVQTIHGVWIVEFGELEQVLGQRAETAVVKAFISRRVDRFRPPYERRPADFPRQCVFAGTVNLESFLRDETGGRRFWPVACGVINLPALERDRDQLWAEARARYEARSPWWLDDPDLIGLAQEQQDMRYEGDPWDPIIWSWVESTQLDWQHSKRPMSGWSVTTEDVLRGPLKKTEAAWQQADKYRIARIMRRHGLEHKQQREFDSDDLPIIGPNGQQKRTWVFRLPRMGATA